MTTLLLIAISFLLCSAGTNGLRHHHQPSSPKHSLVKSASVEIQQACNATRHPDACQAQLAQSPPAQPDADHIIVSALDVSVHNLKTAESMVNDILAASSGNHNRSTAAKTCLQLLDYSVRRTTAASDAVLRNSLKDARAWESAALVYQYDCWSALKYVNDTRGVNDTMAFMNDALIVSTSNALSMVAALINYGADTASWVPPRTERDGFWEAEAPGSSELGFGGEFPTGIEADATVCGTGCDYATVQQAVEAAPDNLEGGKRHVIYIKEGVYKETVTVAYEKKNLVVIGDGVGKSVITGSLNTGLLGIPTYNTATFGVFGDGFMASGLTIQNTAGAGAGQAVAFRSDSDLSFIENCEFLGNQDTLYAHSLRQLYKSCHIEGNVDFIFGMSASLFQNCTILIRPRQLAPEKGDTNAVTAHGRTDPAQATGFAFFGCLVNGTDDYMRLYQSKPKAHRSYLGRPWKEFSRTVFIDSVMEVLISPAGWLPWTGEFALSTLYYGEYGNTGVGANLSSRVSWSSQIPAEHVGAYSAKNFVQADEYSIALADKSSAIPK
ncbi:hypothetical protein V2J09_005466 [Rumex salicifolius]